jgi:integrase/recombinase XerD
VDIDFRHELARVTAKPKWDFTPKNWEERVVPLPHGLMERLKRRMERKKVRPHDLVFGNTKGKPDSELDMVVKRLAERAGLNCGHCVSPNTATGASKAPSARTSFSIGSVTPSRPITFVME